MALEAIGGTITLSYGFTNAVVAILVVCGLMFVTGVPICLYAARYGVDIDLLTRGAGFGYIGSTITSLIYASFTFIFFAIEAVIMSMALRAVLRRAAAARLRHQRAGRHPAGDARHHLHQPLPALDPAGLGGAAPPALRRSSPPIAAHSFDGLDRLRRPPATAAARFDLLLFGAAASVVLR